MSVDQHALHDQVIEEQATEKPVTRDHVKAEEFMTKTCDTNITFGENRKCDKRHVKSNKEQV